MRGEREEKDAAGIEPGSLQFCGMGLRHLATGMPSLLFSSPDFSFKFFS